MGLVLHCGAHEVDFAALRDLPTPPATPTHVPIPHFRLIDLLKHSLSYYDHRVTDEHHGVTEDGMRYFGLLSLRSTYGGYEDTVGVRNSHDKAFSVSIGFGSRVFVCDNLSFYAEHVIRRKHTANMKRDLPGLIGEVVEGLEGQRAAQHQCFQRYKATPLSTALADHAVMELYRSGVITPRRIAEVVREWDSPSFAYEELAERSAWRLFNAVTFVLTGRVMENGGVTQKLHNVIDGTCMLADLTEAA